jgi:hypothetical protein
VFRYDKVLPLSTKFEALCLGNKGGALNTKHSASTSKFSTPNNRGLRTSVEKPKKIRIAITKAVFKVH